MGEIVWKEVDKKKALTEYGAQKKPECGVWQQQIGCQVQTSVQCN